jgi:hypothetical protein
LLLVTLIIEAVMSEFQLTLSLNAAEVRVLKAALLVEIAALEFKAREDHQPDVWLPALSSARRVLSALCDRGNRALLDL